MAQYQPPGESNPFAGEDEDIDFGPQNAALRSEPLNPFAADSLSNPPPRGIASPSAQKAPASLDRREADSQKKAAELEAWEKRMYQERESELARREAELLEREKALTSQQATARNREKKNFPPLCPVMRHHIKEDIPPQHARLMRGILLLWSLSVLAIIYNIFACLMILTSKAFNGGETTNFGVSFNYIVTVGVTSFFLWYLPIYHAFKKDNGFYFMMFLVFNGFHILFLLYMALGPGINSGSGGLINFISVATTHDLGVIIVTAIDFGAWVCLAIFDLYLWFRVQRIHKRSGKSLKDVQNEAVRTVATSDAGKAMGQAAAGAYMKSVTGDFAA